MTDFMRHHIRTALTRARLALHIMGGEFRAHPLSALHEAYRVVKRGITIKYKRAVIGPYLLSFNDPIEAVATAREVFHHRIYRIDCNHRRPVILDIGANIGLSALFFASEFPDATIHAYEPNIEAFRMLKKNISDNHRTGIRLNRKAVLGNGRSGKHAYLFGSSTSTVISSLFRDIAVRFSYPGSVITKTPVPYETLTEVCNRTGTVHIAKIDIEGGEYELLNDLIRNAGRIERIIIETHRVEGKNIFEFLTQLDTAYVIAVDGLPSNTIEEINAFLDNPKKSHNNLLVYGVSRLLTGSLHAPVKRHTS